MKGLLQFLRPGGLLVYTLKFSGISRDRQKSIGVLHDVFSGVLAPGELLWLFANSVCERTYVARKL